MKHQEEEMGFHQRDLRRLKQMHKKKKKTPSQPKEEEISEQEEEIRRRAESSRSNEWLVWSCNTKLKLMQLEDQQVEVGLTWSRQHWSNWGWGRNLHWSEPDSTCSLHPAVLHPQYPNCSFHPAASTYNTVIKTQSC